LASRYLAPRTPLGVCAETVKLRIRDAVPRRQANVKFASAPNHLTPARRTPGLDIQAFSVFRSALPETQVASATKQLTMYQRGVLTVFKTLVQVIALDLPAAPRQAFKPEM
jgi:hypothetical protein